MKPEDNNIEQAGAGGGRQKLIREVFLPRLLATKVHPLDSTRRNVI